MQEQAYSFDQDPIYYIKGVRLAVLIRNNKSSVAAMKRSMQRLSDEKHWLDIHSAEQYKLDFVEAQIRAEEYRYNCLIEEQKLIDNYKKKWADLLNHLTTITASIQESGTQEAYNALINLKKELSRTELTMKRIEACDELVTFVAKAHAMSETLKDKIPNEEQRAERLQLLGEFQSLAIKLNFAGAQKAIGYALLIVTILMGAIALFALCPPLAAVTLGIGMATQVVGLLSVTFGFFCALSSVPVLTISYFESRLERAAPDAAKSLLGQDFLTQKTSPTIEHCSFFNANDTDEKLNQDIEEDLFGCSRSAFPAH